MRDIDSLDGDEKFKERLWEIALLHAKKQADYGTDSDPFANVRAAEGFGVPPWVGVAIRLNDKIRRLMTAATKGTLANESLLDTFMDIAVYGAIGAVFVEEGNANAPIDEGYVASLSKRACNHPDCAGC